MRQRRQIPIGTVRGSAAHSEIADEAPSSDAASQWKNEVRDEANFMGRNKVPADGIAAVHRLALPRRGVGRGVVGEHALFAGQRGRQFVRRQYAFSSRLTARTRPGREVSPLVRIVLMIVELLGTVRVVDVAPALQSARRGCRRCAW